MNTGARITRSRLPCRRRPAGPRPPFAVIFAAEWGDLTQLLTANLAAHYHAPLSVATGAILALWAVSAIAVTGGRWLGRSSTRSHPDGTAVLLAGLGIYTAVDALS